jgi:hypothetical protein
MGVALALQLLRQLEEWFELMSADRVRVHGHRQVQQGVAASLHRPLRLHRVPFAVPARAPSALAPAQGAAPRSFALGARDAERLYRSRFAHVELFPADIGHVLDNALSRGTFLAIVGDGGF